MCINTRNAKGHSVVEGIYACVVGAGGYCEGDYFLL